ncbi:MAG: hypothetical protein K2K81_07345 [Muribaculaceae bacterium]|nr:hypothetical protein [Muribaculaceae bacterium]
MEKLIPTSRRPDITFKSSGEICITSRVARILNLTDRSCINIAKERGEYLLFAEHHQSFIGNHSARCHPVNPGSRYFRANSVLLCHAILEACGATARVSLMCGEEIHINGKPYLPIITKAPL